MRGRLRCVLGAVLLAGVAAAQPLEKEAPAPAPATTLVNSAGKEVRLTAIRFTVGARRLGWLADPKAPAEEDRRGPLALELREPHSTTYQKGVVTLVPTASVMAIRYEYDKQEMSVEVKGLAGPLKGTLQYRGINVCGIEGKVGEAAAKYTGGVAKDGFRSVAFPEAKPLPTRPPAGPIWSIQIDQVKAGHPTLIVRNLKALIAFPGGVETLTDSLPTRKNGMQPVVLASSLKRLEMIAVDQNTQTAVVEITTDDGTAQEKLVAIPLTREQAGRTGVLVGLVGEVEAGWKLFPLHTIKVIQQAEAKP